MTLEEFWEELEEIKGDWEINSLGEIRLGDECPIVAVANKKNGYKKYTSEKYDDAAKEISLWEECGPVLVNTLASAADDPDFNLFDEDETEIRWELLRILGLEES